MDGIRFIIAWECQEIRISVLQHMLKFRGKLLCSSPCAGR